MGKHRTVKVICANPACHREFDSPRTVKGAGRQMFCSNPCREQVSRTARAGQMRSTQRRRRLMRLKLPELSREQLAAMIEASGVIIVKCPPGTHMGFVPKMLKDLV